MNKTQKGAWYCLAMSLLMVSVCLYIAVKILVFKRLPENILGRYLWAILYFIVTLTPIIFLWKKQSPHEVDFDERDKLIKANAVLASFVSIWVLLAIFCIGSNLIVGLAGSIPVWVLSIIGFGIFLIISLIYSIAVLIQYVCGGKSGKD